MHEAKALGYEVYLIFVCLDEPESNILRIQERVSRGVPAEDVLRRYHAAWQTCRGFDNSGGKARKVLETPTATITWSLPDASEPAWVTRLRQALQ